MRESDSPIIREQLRKYIWLDTSTLQDMDADFVYAFSIGPTRYMITIKEGEVALDKFAKKDFELKSLDITFPAMSSDKEEIVQASQAAREEARGHLDESEKPNTVALPSSQPIIYPSGESAATKPEATIVQPVAVQEIEHQVAIVTTGETTEGFFTETTITTPTQPTISADISIPISVIQPAETIEVEGTPPLAISTAKSPIPKQTLGTLYPQRITQSTQAEVEIQKTPKESTAKSFLLNKLAGLTDTQKRVVVTLLFVGAYLLVGIMPIPGLGSISGGSLGAMIGTTGGIFALGLKPYFISRTIMQIVATFVPRFKKIQGTETYKEEVNKWTRLLTIPFALGFAITQLISIAQGPFFIPGLLALQGTPLIIVVGLALTAGSFIIAVFTEKIDKYGIANGTGVLIAVNILQGALSAPSSTFTLNSSLILPLILLTIAALFIQSFTFKVRGILDLSKETSIKDKEKQQDLSLKFKLNYTGVNAIMITTVLLTILNSRVNTILSGLVGEPSVQMATVILTGLLIALFTIGTSLGQFNPQTLQESLERKGRQIKGVRSRDIGRFIVFRKLLPRAAIGAVIVGLIAIIPDLLVENLGLPVMGIGGGIFKGSTLLLLTGTLIDAYSKIRYSQADMARNRPIEFSIEEKDRLGSVTSTLKNLGFMTITIGLVSGFALLAKWIVGLPGVLGALGSLSLPIVVIIGISLVGYGIYQAVILRFTKREYVRLSVKNKQDIARVIKDKEKLKAYVREQATIDGKVDIGTLQEISLRLAEGQRISKRRLEQLEPDEYLKLIRIEAISLALAVTEIYQEEVNSKQGFALHPNQILAILLLTDIMSDTGKMSDVLLPKGIREKLVGYILELATGEGKTLVMASSAYVYSRAEKGCHFTTHNPDLAYLQSKEITEFLTGWLNTSIGVVGIPREDKEVNYIYSYDPAQQQVVSEEIIDDIASEPVKRAYGCDITVGPKSTMNFDEQTDRMFRELFATVDDEADVTNLGLDQHVICSGKEDKFIKLLNTPGVAVALENVIKALCNVKNSFVVDLDKGRLALSTSGTQVLNDSLRGIDRDTADTIRLLFSDYRIALFVICYGVTRLKESDHFEVDVEEGKVSLTENGDFFIADLLGLPKNQKDKYILLNELPTLAHFLWAAMRVRFHFSNTDIKELNQDPDTIRELEFVLEELEDVAKDGKTVKSIKASIYDVKSGQPATGRTLESMQLPLEAFSLLSNSVSTETKSMLQFSQSQRRLTQMTNQEFTKKYPHRGAASATIGDKAQEREWNSIGLKVARLPKDNPPSVIELDTQLYLDADEQLPAIAQMVADHNEEYEAGSFVGVYSKEFIDLMEQELIPILIEEHGYTRFNYDSDLTFQQNSIRMNNLLKAGIKVVLLLSYKPVEDEELEFVKLYTGDRGVVSIVNTRATRGFDIGPKQNVLAIEAEVPETEDIRKQFIGRIARMGATGYSGSIYPVLKTEIYTRDNPFAEKLKKLSQEGKISGNLYGTTYGKAILDSINKAQEIKVVASSESRISSGRFTGIIQQASQRSDYFIKELSLYSADELKVYLENLIRETARQKLIDVDEQVALALFRANIASSITEENKNNIIRMIRQVMTAVRGDYLEDTTTLLTDSELASFAGKDVLGEFKIGEIELFRRYMANVSLAVVNQLLINSNLLTEEDSKIVHSEISAQDIPPLFVNISDIQPADVTMLSDDEVRELARGVAVGGAGMKPTGLAYQIKTKTVKGSRAHLHLSGQIRKPKEAISPVEWVTFGIEGRHDRRVAIIRINANKISSLDMQFIKTHLAPNLDFILPGTQISLIYSGTEKSLNDNKAMVNMIYSVVKKKASKGASLSAYIVNEANEATMLSKSVTWSIPVITPIFNWLSLFIRSPGESRTFRERVSMIPANITRIKLKPSVLIPILTSLIILGASAFPIIRVWATGEGFSTLSELTKPQLVASHPGETHQIAQEAVEASQSEQITADLPLEHPEEERAQQVSQDSYIPHVPQMVVSTGGPPPDKESIGFGEWILSNIKGLNISISHARTPGALAAPEPTFDLLGWVGIPIFSLISAASLLKVIKGLGSKVTDSKVKGLFRKIPRSAVGAALWIIIIVTASIWSITAFKPPAGLIIEEDQVVEGALESWLSDMEHIQSYHTEIFPLITSLAVFLLFALKNPKSFVRNFFPDKTQTTATGNISHFQRLLAAPMFWFMLNVAGMFTAFIIRSSILQGGQELVDAYNSWSPIKQSLYDFSEDFVFFWANDVFSMGFYIGAVLIALKWISPKKAFNALQKLS